MHAQGTISGEVNSMEAASLWSSLALVRKSRPFPRSVTQKWSWCGKQLGGACRGGRGSQDEKRAL